MPLDPAPLLRFEANYRWTNKHGNVRTTAARLYSVWNRTSDGSEPPRQRWRAGLSALRKIAMDAETAGCPLRAYGGGWSLSKAAVCADFLLNTKPLNYISIGLRREQVLASSAAIASRLVFAQCGIHVMELHAALEGQGLALPTCGASNGQTLAGAVATGTHGAALDFGAMQEFVRGIHLVVGGGRHVYVERASAPVVSNAFVGALGAELRRDDALFEAALVSFGGFGLVHAFLIEAVPIFQLERYRFRVDHAEALELLELDFARLAAHELPRGRPHHFEITFDPYRPGTRQSGAYVTAMYRRSGARARNGARSAFEAGDDLLCLIGELTDFTPRLIPRLTSALAERQLSRVSGARATPGETFGNSSIRGPVHSAELGVAIGDARRAVEAILDAARSYPFPGLVATRFVKSSTATLAFTRFSPITCTIELPAAGSSRSLELFRRVWARLDQESIRFTLHWGQEGDWSAGRVRAMFGAAAVDAWLGQRRALLGRAGRLFTSPFLEACGLAG